jgi:DinB family protein
MSTIDPVAQPSEYQVMLLRYLGDQDPADVQAQTPDVIADIIGEAGEFLRARPAQGEWSVLELLGHVFDAEIVYSGRYRWTIAHDGPPLVGYEQDDWVERLRHNEDDPAGLLSVLRALRAANVQLWSRTSPEERERVGIHAERGPESLDLSFRLIAGHDLFHIEQMNRTLQELRDDSTAGAVESGD